MDKKILNSRSTKWFHNFDIEISHSIRIHNDVMEIFLVLVALCEGNLPVPSGFP